MNKIKKFFKESGIHEVLRTLFKGFRRVVCGAVIAGMMGAAVYLFAIVPGFSGYLAVVVFIGGAAFLIEALWQMWVIGGGNKRPGEK